jgi:hypothetical protein
MQCKVNPNHNTRADGTCIRYNLCGGSKDCVASPVPLTNKEVKKRMSQNNKEKPKADKKPKEPKADAPVFPCETTINGYAFMRVPVKAMKAIGVKTVKREKDQKEIFAETKVVIQGFDAAANTLTIKLA